MKRAIRYAAFCAGLLLACLLSHAQAPAVPALPDVPAAARQAAQSIERGENPRSCAISFERPARRARPGKAEADSWPRNTWLPSSPSPGLRARRGQRHLLSEGSSGGRAHSRRSDQLLFCSRKRRSHHAQIRRRLCHQGPDRRRPRPILTRRSSLSVTASTRRSISWNDFDGIDVKGKVLLAIVNEPPSEDESFFKGKALTYYGRWTYKYEEAARRGAVGVLVIHRADLASYGWDVVRNSQSTETVLSVRRSALDAAGGQLDTARRRRKAVSRSPE